jgi:ABC-2 type transport system permease protein
MTLSARRLAVYALETKYEFLKQFRLPVAILFNFGFPVMFYTVFGLIFGRQTSSGGASYAAYYIATYGAFGVISSALFGIGVGMAMERGQGWMLLKRASPMPVEAYVIAKLAVSVLAAALIVILLTTCGVVLLGLRVDPLVWARLFAAMVIGALPFSALGLAIGCWAGPNSAVAISNLINIPMALVSGLWIPLNLPFMPAFVRQIAVFSPAYHYSQLALATVGEALDGSAVGHALVLLGFATLCVVLAYVGYRRDEGKTYG